MAIKNKFTFLDLYSGTQSLRKALEKLFGITEWNQHKIYPFLWTGISQDGETIKYIGVDIYSPQFQNLHFDLSQPNVVQKLIEALPEDFKPNFVWASPVCSKFSIVISGKGGNYYFEIDRSNDTIYPRKNWNIKTQPMMSKYQNQEGWLKANKDAKMALKLFQNTKKIIDHFDVKFVIENPATALSRYILKEYFKNNTAYCMYGFDYKKPTAIYSNVELSLKKCIHKKHCSNVTGGKRFIRPSHWEDTSTYANRSSVPPLLIKSIFNQLLKQPIKNDHLDFLEMIERKQNETN